MKGLLNTNEYVSLHPLKGKKLVEGLEEIVFRLMIRGGEEGGEQPEKISRFFWKGIEKHLTCMPQS